MVRKGRVAVCLFAALLAVAMLFSVFFIALEAEHDCVGEDCPICQFIARIEQVRRALGSVLPALLGAWLVVITCRETRERTPADAPVFSTLVGRKIRLND